MVVAESCRGLFIQIVSNELCFPLFIGRTKSILFHAINQRLPTDAQVPGRFRLVPVMLFQCLEQNFLFDVLQTDTLFGQFEADVCNPRPALSDARR
jgi:hypothetical protein